MSAHDLPLQSAMTVEQVPGVIVSEGSPLRSTLVALSREARMIFFAGLPGTGKSLLIHQLAHLAHARGRRVHLLQWDVARPAFEASAPGLRYPQERGVTHGVIRLAVGRWARSALASWHIGHPGWDDVLIGETPFVGHRLIELCRREHDEAEALLSAPWTRFVIPVPSRDLRAHLEAERARRARTPLHRREQEDAPPEVLRDLWRQLIGVARILDVADPTVQAGEDTPYDPALYRAVYERLLVHRHTQTLALDTALPAGAMSAYDFKIPTVDVLPAEPDAARAIRDVEAGWPDAEALRREIDAWYRT